MGVVVLRIIICDYGVLFSSHLKLTFKSWFLHWNLGRTSYSVINLICWRKCLFSEYQFDKLQITIHSRLNIIGRFLSVEYSGIVEYNNSRIVDTHIDIFPVAHVNIHVLGFLTVEILHLFVCIFLYHCDNKFVNVKSFSCNRYYRNYCNRY